MGFYYFSICHASLWDLGKEKDTIKPLSYTTEAWSLNIIMLKKWLYEIRTQIWFQNWREKGQKIQVLNCKSTYSMIGLWWSIHHSAASINLGPILNYNLLLEFLDDIKMCGINRQYQALCVTIVAKQCIPSGAWRIISWVKILMSRLSRLLLLFWEKKHHSVESTDCPGFIIEPLSFYSLISNFFVSLWETWVSKQTIINLKEYWVHLYMIEI